MEQLAAPTGRPGCSGGRQPWWVSRLPNAGEMTGRQKAIGPVANQTATREWRSVWRILKSHSRGFIWSRRIGRRGIKHVLYTLGAAHQQARRNGWIGLRMEFRTCIKTVCSWLVRRVGHSNAVQRRDTNSRLYPIHPPTFLSEHPNSA